MSAKRSSTLVHLDSVIALIITFVFFLFFVAIDFTEWWFEVTRDYEHLELDELSGLVLGALIGLLYANLRLLKRSKADTASIKALSEEMETQAYTDYLTDLPNRRALDKHVNRLVAESSEAGEEFTLMYIDLDGFKYVNDTLGHSVGDLLLKEVANRLDEAKPENAMLARIGGDEFCLVIPGYVSDQMCFYQCNYLDAQMERPFFVGGHKLNVSQTVGISRFPEDGGSFEQLLKTADMAMYLGKRNGLDKHNFSDHRISQDMNKRFLVRHGLEEAIEMEQFFIMYQPKVDLATNGVVGCEALIRWQHPEHGIIPPDEFIAIAEEANLIHKIDFFVLETVCKQIKQWGTVAYPVAVNLSPGVFSDDRLAEKILGTLNKYDIDPDMIEIEITERTLIANSDTPFRVCQALSEAGVRLSLDDFGTGYSSLSHMAKYPIDIIKIDRSFVNKIQENSRMRHIVSAIVQLASSLNMKVVAEGVETAEQGALLKSMGCDEAQGYFFGKPLALSDYTNMLRRDTEEDRLPSVLH